MTDIRYEQPRRDPEKNVSKWFWGGFITILLLGVLIALFSAIRGGKQWAESILVEAENQPESWVKVIRVTLSGGESIFIDSQSVVQIRERTQTWTEERFDQIKSELFSTLDNQTETIFENALKNIPAYTDWHYSLKGEYSRLLYAAFADLPTYLSEKLLEIVFQPAGTIQAIDELTKDMDNQLSSSVRLATLDLQSFLTQLVRSHQVESQNVQIDLDGQWTLGTQLAENLGDIITLKPQDFARQGLATSAGAAVSAATVKKLGATTVAKASSQLAGKSSFGALASMATKLGLKSAAKTGGTMAGAGTGAASGAALCTGTIAGAPLAPGCALIGGALMGLTTWMLVDKAVLETEELLNRDEFEQQLNHTLRIQRDELLATMKVRLENALQTSSAQIHGILDHQVRPLKTAPQKDFVPALAK